MKKTVWSLAILAALVLTVSGISGCIDSSAPGDKVKDVSLSIRLGTSSAIAIGLVAIPNEEEADGIAEEASRVMTENVLPILQGDEAGLVEGLTRLLDLSVFDDNPKLAKLKFIIESVLPLLEKYIPDNLVDQGLDKIPADVKSYMTAFFIGIHQGVESYLGRGSEGLQGAGKYKALRKKLTK